MSAGHEGDDDRAFYHAAIEHTYEIAATAAGVQTSDDDGPLPPGRYLIQVSGRTPTNNTVWIITGKWVKGSPIALSTGQGKNRVPLPADAAVAIEFNVAKGYNDRVGAITTAGTATVWVTRVSRTGKIPGES